MHIDVSADSAYWFQSEQIHALEKQYNAVYMGFWSIKQHDGSWSDTPVDVFYRPDPDPAQTHSHYFGVFLYENQPILIDADSAFSEPMTGILLKSGEVLVSRFRDDLQSREGNWINGGRSQIKHQPNAKLVQITVQQNQFIFETHMEYLS